MIKQTGQFKLGVREQGYVTVECLQCHAWDQFPVFAADFLFFLEWAENHLRLSHGGSSRHSMWTRRSWWYRLRLSIREMNRAAARMTDPRVRS